MSETPELTDDDDQAWSDAWSDETDREDGALSEDPPPAVDEPDPEAPPPEQPPAGQEQEPEPEPEPEEPETIESLKQKLRSAEGRFNKFEEHITDLRQKIEQREKPDEPEETPEPDTFLPEGWSQEDWDDFSTDYPVQAELLENQSRQVKSLTDRLDTTEQHLSVTEQNRVFNDSIRKAHPDYDDLLADERQQIVDFIEGQPNPTLKAAYQNIYQDGSAEQIISLVSDYKENGRKPAGKDKPPVSQRNIDNALAVPGRSRSPNNISGRAGLPDEDDFDGGWDYFSDDSID